MIASDEDVRIESPMPQAAIHQLGGEIKMPERTGMVHQHYDAKTDTLDQKFRKKARAIFSREVTIRAHTINMPKRSYLGVSKEDEVTIIRIAREWLGDE
nr:phage virion morphogenesis protein [Shinella daejeonensis]